MKKMMIALAFAALAFAGCRQKDVRDFTVEVPALAQGNEATVTETIRSALAGCCGIDMSTLAFDSANHCVKMRYDSMQIAKKNIEMAMRTYIHSMIYTRPLGNVMAKASSTP